MSDKSARRSQSKGKEYCDNPGASCQYDENDICVHCNREKGWRRKPKREGVIDKFVAAIFDGTARWSPLKIIDLIEELDGSASSITDMLEAFHDELAHAYPAIHKEMYGDSDEDGEEMAKPIPPPPPPPNDPPSSDDSNLIGIHRNAADEKVFLRRNGNCVEVIAQDGYWLCWSSSDIPNRMLIWLKRMHENPSGGVPVASLKSRFDKVSLK